PGSVQTTSFAENSQKKGPKSPTSVLAFSATPCAVRPSGSVSRSTTGEEPLAPASPKFSPSTMISPSPPGGRLAGSGWRLRCHQGEHPTPHCTAADAGAALAAITAGRAASDTQMRSLTVLSLSLIMASLL